MTQKPGRNNPCPCGSGKKFKQCCLNKLAPVLPAHVNDPTARRAFQQALILFRQGQLSQAEGLCQRLLQETPNFADALHLLGAITLQQGNLEVSTKLLEHACNLVPANPEFHNNLGLAYHENGMLSKAEFHYRKALALAPHYANAAFNLHALLINSNDLGPAIREVQRALQFQPYDQEARFILGILYEYAGQEEKAAEQFGLVAQGNALDKARLDAWQYLRSDWKQKPEITGCGLNTFKLALAAAPENGLVLEFGVRFGTSIRKIAAIAKQTVHGFDSFEGLPEVWHHEPKGSYTTKGAIPDVPNNVALHVGWFEDTLPTFLEQHPDKVRFINIDCDIYSSTKTVLDQLASRIQPGTVLVFDEFIGNEHWREDEFKAFQESVAKYGWKYEYICFSVFTKQVAIKITE
jgi:Flp pilus assembly protein TadD